MGTLIGGIPEGGGCEYGFMFPSMTTGSRPWSYRHFSPSIQNPLSGGREGGRGGEGGGRGRREGGREGSREVTQGKESCKSTNHHSLYISVSSSLPLPHPP